MKKKTFLLTGATGYLGANILRRLVKFEANFFCLKRKSSNIFRIKDLESEIRFFNIEDINFEKLFLDHKVDTIIHCATDYGRKNVDPICIIDANLTLPLKLLHYGSIAGVNSFINTDTVLNKNIDSYSLSKKQFLDWLQKYSKKIKTINVATQHFYGPGDDPTKFTAHIIQSLINDEPKILMTAGNQRRDFIFIEDVVDAFIKIIESIPDLNADHHSFEVGTGTSHKIKDFVNLTKTIIGNKKTILDFGALPYREGEVMDIITNSESLINLGWKNKFSLEEGLSLTIEKEREKKT